MKTRIFDLFKRLFDIIASLLGLIVTSPLWLIAVIGIELSDPGPVFYVANRIGRENKPFPMYKFRSMRQGKADESVFRGEESRIFPFGKFMRDSKIDELPQLLCCFLGTMSVIGPRPAAKDQMKITRGGKYAEAAKVKPGLSGPAAIYDYIYGDTVLDEAAYEQSVLPTRLALEVYYVRHRSVILDVQMICYTVVCILLSLFHKQPTRILNQMIRWAQTIE